MKYAPIVLFVFMRPEHTRRTLESLAKNPEFLESPLYIYCDGARTQADFALVEKTRKLIRDWPHAHKTVIESEKNLGLANSVITGVTKLCEVYGRVIVVEDDLIVSPVFLNYMNSALEKYEKSEQVMQISAHMFPVSIKSDKDAVILPFTTSWGWATWGRAWSYFDPKMSGVANLNGNKVLRRKFDLSGTYPAFKMLKRQEKGTVDSWAIRWYLSVFMNNGLVLFPKQTLVLNDGFDGSGTNCRNTIKLDTENIRTLVVEKFPDETIDEQAFLEITSYLRKDQSFSRKLFKYLGAIWEKLQK